MFYYILGEHLGYTCELHVPQCGKNSLNLQEEEKTNHSKTTWGICSQKWYQGGGVHIALLTTSLCTKTGKIMMLSVMLFVVAWRECVTV